MPINTIYGSDPFGAVGFSVVHLSFWLFFIVLIDLIWFGLFLNLVQLLTPSIAFSHADLNN